MFRLFADFAIEDHVPTVDEDALSFSSEFALCDINCGLCSEVVVALPI